MLVTPGIMYMVIHVYRCMMGSAFICVPASTVPVVAVAVSRSGAAALTSTFSTTLPTFICTSRASVSLERSARPSRSSVANPGFWNVSL